MDKEQQIIALITRLRADLGHGAFDIVDHWAPDLCAIGIACSAEHSQLVYISTYNQPAGKYDYELETAPRSDGDIYDVAERGDADYDSLIRIIRRHLRLNP